VHGWHEFVGEREAELHDKVASAAFVACISDFTRSQLMRISSPADWTKIHVVRCGIVPDRFARRSPTAPGATARIAIVARVSPEKGHAVLIEALSVLRKRGIAVALDAVGPEAGDHGDLLRQLAVDAGVADCITWHGPQPSSQVAQILAESDIFCLPTFAEGLPVVIMEAMARGVPVVTTYISGIPELAVDEKTALIVPAARVDALAEAMERLIVDGDLRQRLVAAAAVAVAEQHDIRRNVPHLAALFNNSEKAWAP
jgi:glycosyltransferase involved in cell wall biosynthesis